MLQDPPPPHLLVLMEMLSQLMVSLEILLHLVFELFKHCSYMFLSKLLDFLSTDICVNMTFKHDFTYYCYFPENVLPLIRNVLLLLL